MKLCVQIRILDGKGNRVFGDGIAELLLLIDKHGSIAEASRAMGMAYSKSWRIIRTFEKAFGRKAIMRDRGGRMHGGAMLTDECRILLKRYLSLKGDLAASVKSRSTKLLRYFKLGR